MSVFGPNGCGKSTLINMIAGLIPVDAGEILFDGKSLAQTKIGYVFQNYREAMFRGCAPSTTSPIRCALKAAARPTWMPAWKNWWRRST